MTNTSNDDQLKNDSGGAAQNDWTIWGLLSGATLISTGLAAYEIVPASVTPLIRDSLNIGPTVAGFLVGAMFGTVVLTSLPAGVVLDRTNSRNAMAYAVLLLFFASSWGWIAGQGGDYWSMVASRVLGGIAYVVVWNAGIDIVSRAMIDTHRATAVGVFTASGPIGFALGQGAGPFIAEWFGWPAIFLAFNTLTVIGLILFWPMSRGLGKTASNAPALDEFASVLRNRNVWLVGILGFLGYSLYLFVNSWGSSYLTEEIGLSLVQSGLLVAMFPAVGILARISSGILSDRLFNGLRQPVFLCSFGLSAPLIFGFACLESIPLLTITLLFAGFAIQLTLGLSFTYVQEVVDSRVAATAIAFQTSIGLSGAFVAPIAGGFVIDFAGFEIAFLFAGTLAIYGILLAWRTPEPEGS